MKFLKKNVFVFFSLCVFISMQGCVTYRIQGGPQKIDREISGTAFLNEAEFLVKKSDNAMFVLRKVKRQTLTSQIFLISCSLCTLGGTITTSLSNNDISVLAAGLSLSIIGLGLCITTIFISPRKSDYAQVLQTYNTDYPNTPYWSPGLDIAKPSRR